MPTKSTRLRTRAGKAGWQSKFLKALSRVPNITAACESARIDRTAAYGMRERHPDFAAQWDIAIQEGIERLEAACWKRAKDGVKRSVWMKDETGKPIKVDDINEYSDHLALGLLKAHAPAKYRDNVRTEISGPNGAPIQVANATEVRAAQLTDAQLDRVIEMAESRALTNGNGHANGNGHSGNGNGVTEGTGTPKVN